MLIQLCDAAGCPFEGEVYDLPVGCWHSFASAWSVIKKDNTVFVKANRHIGKALAYHLVSSTTVVDMDKVPYTKESEVKVMSNTNRLMTGSDVPLVEMFGESSALYACIMGSFDLPETRQVTSVTVRWSLESDQDASDPENAPRVWKRDVRANEEINDEGSGFTIKLSQLFRTEKEAGDSAPEVRAEAIRARIRDLEKQLANCTPKPVRKSKAK